VEKESAKKLIRETFERSFERDHFIYFVKNLLNKLDESGSTVLKGSHLPDSYKPHIESLEYVGSYEDEEVSGLDVLVVQLKKETSLDRARAMQRNFISWYLNGGRSGVLRDASIVAFVSPSGSEWRFSFVKMDYTFVEDKSGKTKVREEFTPSRRYSFLVGENENSHTAKSQLLPLLENDEEKPTLGEIEEKFNIETVTKEFFESYRDLFLRVAESLDEIIKSDSRIKKDFLAKGVGAVDFSKKLLGQIVFLYFLQKKGWFGVEKDSDWGSGSRHFIRNLFDQKNTKYKNFFNEILEPLFYEALASKRQSDYYAYLNCKIPFLNGGLFDPIGNYDWVHTDILLPNDLFSNKKRTPKGDIGTGIFDVLDRYNFTVREDEPLEKEVAVDPEMLGKVFENLLDVKDRKSKGTFYTPREIVHYMCKESLIHYLVTDLKGKVSKEEVETLILFGETVVENDSRVAKAGKETERYSYKLPKSVIKNASVIDTALANIRICDPAVGSGAFLVGMMSEIVSIRNALSSYLKGSSDRSSYGFKRHAIHDSLYGVDIDTGAIEICKLRLWLSLVVDEDDISQIQPLPNLDYKIVAGNSLLGVQKNLFNEQLFRLLEEIKPRYFDEPDRDKKEDCKQEIEKIICELTDGKEAFDFEIYFSEVFQDKHGFNVLIGNPPYGALLSKEFKSFVRAHYETVAGEMDSYLLFIEKAAKLLRSDGILSFIVPDTWLTLINAERFRRWILTNYELPLVALLNGLVFHSAIVDTMLIFLVHSKPLAEKSTRVLEAKKDLRVFDVNELPVKILRNQLRWLEETQAQIKLFASPEYESLLAKIKSGSPRLDELLEYRAGCKPYEVGKGNPPQTKETLKQKPFTSSERQGKEWMPLVRGNDIKRYIVIPKKPEWIKYGKWLAAPRILEIFQGRRILIQAIRNPSLDTRIVAALADDTFIPRINVYSLFPKQNVDVDLELVLSILNSKLMNWMLKKDYGLHTYVITGVLALPIKPIGSKDPQAIKIIKLLKQILVMKKQRGAPEKLNVLEQEIDQLVYEVYGLTQEEIQIVEKSGAG
jgi:type I restriction-modification system DNA methylase subunit